MFIRRLRGVTAWPSARLQSAPLGSGARAVVDPRVHYSAKRPALVHVAGAAVVVCAAALWFQQNDGDAVCEQKAPVPLDGILTDIDEIYRREKEAAHIPGMVYGVMSGGQLVHSVALGLADVERAVPVDLSTSFRIASMSKSFIALAIMQLRDRGRLRLEDPVSKYIPHLKLIPVSERADDYPVLTIRHLLTHAGGLPQEDPWGDRKLDMSTADFNELISHGVSHSSVPGTAFEYSNLGYTLLGQIVEIVSGEPYQCYVKSNIFDPLGMNDTSYEIDEVSTRKLAVGYRWEDRKWSREEMLHDGTFGAMVWLAKGGIVTTLEDFSKYVALHLSAWPAGGSVGDGPVRRDTLREMHTAAILDAVLVDPAGFSANPTPAYFANCYGLGFRVSKYPDGTILVGHAGGLPGFGCDFRFLPTHPGFSILSFTNRTYGEMPKVNLMAIKRVLRDVERAPVPISFSLERRSIQLKAILTETCVVPHRKCRLSYNYESIWNKTTRNCFADNFLVDIPSRIRAIEFHKLLVELGGYISHFSPIVATNSLRGKFLVTGVNGRQLEIAFTLSPEKEPKIQHMTTKLLPVA